MDHDDAMESAAWSAASADPALWLSAAIVLALALYVWGMWRFDRFTAQGMPFLPARPFVGAAAPFLLQRRDFHRYVQGLYAKARGPLVGFFHGQNAALLLRDPRLVRRALVEAAAAFPLRAPPSSAHDHSTTIGRRVVGMPPHPMLDKHLMGLPWRSWRGVRRELDTSFSAALKALPCLEAVDDAARRLTQVIEIKAAKLPANRGVDIRKPLDRYWSDSLGAVILGRCGSVDEDFHSKRTALCSASDARSRWFHSLCPRIAQMLRVPATPRNVEKYFHGLGEDMARNVKKSWLLGCNEGTIATEDLNEKLRRSSALWHILVSYMADNTTGKESGTLEWRSKSNTFPTLQVILPTRKRSLKMAKMEVTLTPITEEVKDATQSASTLSSSTVSSVSSPEEHVDPRVIEIKERLGVVTNEVAEQYSSRTCFTANEENVTAGPPGRDITDSLERTIDAGNLMKPITLTEDTRPINCPTKAENRVNAHISEEGKINTNMKITECNKEVIDDSISDFTLQPKILNTIDRKLEENHEVSTGTRDITKTESEARNDIPIHIQKHESTETTVTTTSALSCVVRSTEKVTHSTGKIDVSTRESLTTPPSHLVNKVLEPENMSRTRAAVMVAEAQVTQAMDSLASKFGSAEKGLYTRGESATLVSACDQKTGERPSPVSGEIIISKEKSGVKLFGPTKKHEILKTEVKNSKLVGHIIVQGKIFGSRKVLMRSSSDNIITVERRTVIQRTRDQVGKERDDSQILLRSVSNMNSNKMETIKTTDILQSTGSEEMRKNRILQKRIPKEREDQMEAIKSGGKEHDNNDVKVQEEFGINTLKNSENIILTEKMKELGESDSRQDTRVKLPMLENKNTPQKLMQVTKCEEVLNSTVDVVVESTKETEIVDKEIDGRKSKEGTRGSELVRETNARRKIGIVGEHPKSMGIQNLINPTVVETKEPTNLGQVPLIQVESEPPISSDSTQTFSKSLNLVASNVTNMSTAPTELWQTSIKVPLIQVEPEESKVDNSTDKPSETIDPMEAEATFHQSARSSTASLAAQVAEGARRGALMVALALRLLAEHPQAQQKAAEEAVKEAEKKGTHTPYIDAVIAETLRLWPPEAVVTRARLGAGPWRGDGAAAAALGVGGTLAGPSSASTATLQPDDVLWVPITALHRDSKYWTRPSEFIPERFLPTREPGSALEGVGEGCEASERGVYLPFGLGPRACAGREVVLHVAKAALLRLLAKLEFTQPTRIERRRRQPRAAMGRYSLEIEGGFSLVVNQRNEKESAV